MKHNIIHLFTLQQIGKFMLLWIPAITDANLLCPYLDMLVNLIKFNAAHLDKDILVGIVQYVSLVSYLFSSMYLYFVFSPETFVI